MATGNSYAVIEQAYEPIASLILLTIDYIFPSDIIPLNIASF